MTDYLIGFLIAGGLGLFGQLLRVGLGLSKLGKANVDANLPALTDFEWPILLWSLFYGAVAGGLSWLATGAPEFAAAPILGCITAGAAGAYFVEGLLQIAR